VALKWSDTVAVVSTPVRRADAVARGVAASFGAGLFLGPAPAASLAGGRLPLAALVGVLVGGAAVLSTWNSPLETVPTSLRRFGFVLSTLARLAAAVALAGTVAVYVTPLAALTVVVVVVVLAAVGVPPVVVRMAAVVVAGVLLLTVIACFAIAPVAPAVAAPDGGSLVGVLGAAGLLAVCMFGASPGAGWSGPVVAGRHGDPADGGGDGSAAEGGGDVGGDGGAGGSGEVTRGVGGAVGCGVAGSVGDVVGGGPEGTGDSPGDGGDAGLPATGDSWRWGRFLVVGVVGVLVLAVVLGAVRQTGAARLAVSPAPLLAALDAADAGALRTLLLIAVVVGCGFGLFGVLRGLPAGGLPHLRVVVAGGVVALAGVLLVPAGVALAGAAVLLLGDSVFRVVAGRHREGGAR
jgi:hypothetical protein